MTRIQTRDDTVVDEGPEGKSLGLWELLSRALLLVRKWYSYEAKFFPSRLPLS